MSDPLQMVKKGSDATPAERELIQAGQSVAMPGSERAAIWASVAAACVVTEAGVAAAAAAAATAAAASALSASAGTSGTMLSLLTSWKGLVLLAALGGSVAAYQVSRPDPVPPQPIAAPVQPAQAIHSIPLRTEPGAEPTAPAVTVAKPSGLVPVRAPTARAIRQPSASAPASEVDQHEPSSLAEESRAVLAARRALRDGDPALCLHLLEAAHAAFPSGSLAQEREILAIRALASAGQRDLAAQRAARFLREHPESPHAAELKSIAP